MELEGYFEFVSPDEIRLRGHRIWLENIVDLFNSGSSPEQILYDYPELSLEAIYATITYYLHNRPGIDASIRRQEETAGAEYEAWKAQPSPTIERLRQIAESR